LPTKKELNTMVDFLNGNDYYWTSEDRYFAASLRTSDVVSSVHEINRE